MVSPRATSFEKRSVSAKPHFARRCRSAWSFVRLRHCETCKVGLMAYNGHIDTGEDRDPLSPVGLQWTPPLFV